MSAPHRFSHIRLTLEPRNVVSQFDLAFSIFRQLFPELLLLWLVHALPAGVIAYVLVARNGYTAMATGIVFLLVSAPLGLFTTYLAVSAAFGQRLSAGRALRDVLQRWPGLCLQTLLVRVLALIGAVFLFIPGWAILLWFGFAAESAFLRRLSDQTFDRSVNDIIRKNFPQLFFQSYVFTSLSLIVWGAALVGIDTALGSGLGFPIIFNRIEVGTDFLAEQNQSAYFVSFLTTDSRVSVAAIVTGLLVYQLGRLAWFLAYVDLRVRHDCWDVELRLVHENTRLLPENNASQTSVV